MVYSIYEQEDFEFMLDSNSLEDFEEGFMMGYLGIEEKKKTKKKI